MSASGPTGPAGSAGDRWRRPAGTGARRGTGATGAWPPWPPIVRGESERVNEHQPIDWQRRAALTLVVLVLAAAFVVLFLSIGDDPERHRREIRYIGDLECVYDPHEARIEACVKASR